MALDFTNQDRIRIDGQDFPLYGFTVHYPAPAVTIPPAGIAPGVEEAMRAAGPPQPESYSFETVTFGCDLTLKPGDIYEYISSDNQHRQLKILSGSHRGYRGVLQ